MPPAEPCESRLEYLQRELASLRIRNSDLEIMFNSSFDGIFINDADGNTLRMNSACSELYGMPLDALMQTNYRQGELQGLFYPALTPLVVEKRQRVTILQTTSSSRRIIVTGNPVFDEKGNVARVVANVRDVTELMTLREELEKAENLVRRYRDELTRLKNEQQVNKRLIARSPAMVKLVDTVKKVAPVDATVLLLGESGVGKNVVAKLIQDLSPRRDGPFVEINCGAVPESLVESELFGYETGAFTGARKQGKPGLIELAESGTLFLNEVGELPLSIQVKLLQVIQDRTLVRIGGSRTRSVNVRFLAATNRDLARMVQSGKFREDLYFRLNVLPLHLPPLRQRVDDIPALTFHFLQKFNSQYGRSAGLTPQALTALISYPWPGNVRELQNVIERLVITTEGSTVGEEEVRQCLYPAEPSVAPESAEQSKDPVSLPAAVALFERSYLLEALKKYKSTYKTARALGVSQPTVVRKLNKYGIKTDTEVH